jgi:hypothetical protein
VKVFPQFLERNVGHRKAENNKEPYHGEGYSYNGSWMIQLFQRGNPQVAHMNLIMLPQSTLYGFDFDDNKRIANKYLRLTPLVYLPILNILSDQTTYFLPISSKSCFVYTKDA